jgi:hypothetical protein
MSKHIIGTTLTHQEVYAHLIQQPLSSSIGRNPHLLALIKEALGHYELENDVEYIEHDMGRNVGYSELLETKEKDIIFYAKQSRSETYTKFVKNRRTTPTTFLTIRLVKDEDGNYEVVNVWLGKKFPPAPGDSHEETESKAYWDQHAVVFNGQVILSNTITKECPY